MEVVAHEKAAAVKELAQRFGLGAGQIPVPHLHRVEPRPIVLIAFVQVHGLLDGARMHARQAPQRFGEMPVRPRIIGSPTGTPLLPGPVAEPAVPSVNPERRRVHQTREGPLGLLLPVMRDREIVVLATRKFAERALRL